MKFSSPSTVVQGWIGKVYSRDDTKLEPPKEGEEKKEEVVVEEEDGDGRQQWSNPIEFLLSCISMSVGLGNVWRFPFTAYDNGGGAFIIPYLIVLFFIGRPFYLLELSLGQFASSGCVKVWDLIPPFRGIGYAQSFATFLVCSYYCVLIAISAFYFFASFQTTLPWTVCHEELGINSSAICLASNTNMSDLNITEENVTVIASTEQYFKKGVLKENPDITDGIGAPDPYLFGCLLLCWLMIYFTLRKGVASSGKVAYFTAIFPYLVMFALLVRGLTLPGSTDGILFLFTPQWEKLYDPQVWYAAVTQSFFSLSIGFGSLTTFSSYNSFRHNIYRDAIIISLADTFTSLLAGVITFSILGHLAHELGQPVKDVVKSGAGLAFISYPEVISKFDFCPQLFAVLFFLMLITLGLGSATGLINTVITVISDEFPNISKDLITGIVCVVGLVSGLVYITPGGQPILELVDYYGGSLLILILAVIEIIALAYIYKTSTLIRDFNFMMNRKLGIFWKFCWSFFIPVALSLILAYTLIFYKPVAYSKVELPVEAQVAGWMLTAAGVAFSLGYFLHTIFRSYFPSNKVGVEQSKQDRVPEKVVDKEEEKNIFKLIKSAFNPLISWGPSSLRDRLDWVGVIERENSKERISIRTKLNNLVACIRSFLRL